MYRGAFSPAVTLFDPTGEIDYKANGAHIEKMIAGGVNGFLFLGSLGEFYNLGSREKRAYIDFVVKQVAGRVPVLIGTAGTNIREVIELSLYAEKAGADAVVIVQPYYMTLNEARAYAFYAQIARAVTIHIFLYNFPDRTGFSLTPALIARLAREFDNIIGIKDTVDNISHTRQIIEAVRQVRSNFVVFSGFDEYLVQNIMFKGNGVISGLNNVAPELFASLTAAIDENDLATIKRLSGMLSDLMALYNMTDSFISTIKVAVSMRLPGICTDLREPGCGLDKKTKQEIINRCKNIFAQESMNR
jgi:dihydrodipicolinate synthase/N-acetylneuraminate lyase